MKILKLIDPTVFHTKLASKNNLSNEDKVNALLKWSKNNPNFRLHITAADFDFFEKTYSHFLISIKDETSEFAGHGRSEDSSVALLKAFSEALERMAMSTYFKSVTSPIYNQLYMDIDGRLAPARFISQYMPTSRMHNSNGWAVDSNLAVAAQRAIFEALERHGMQSLYWLKGLSFLKPLQKLVFNKSVFELSRITLTKKLDIAICSVSDPSFRGHAFGHSCAYNSSFPEAWTHPMIEAFQIIESSRTNSSQNDPENIFDQIQQNFLRNDDLPKTPVLSFDPLPPQGIELNIVAIDLNASWKIGIPMYACWVFSDQLMPLYLESILSQSDRAIFEEQYYKIFGHVGELCQTPFI